MSAAIAYPLKFQVGARTLLTVRRRLVRKALSLEEVLQATPPALPALPADAHGYVVNSLPAALLPVLEAQFPELRAWVRQSYTRHHADLARGWDAYLAGFSSKTRSTLQRKVRRFGEIDVRLYRTPEEIATFAELARDVSRASYQERLLDAGLPDAPADRARMADLAAHDRVRAFLLFRNDRPISYLYLPASGDTLIYAYLGFDPACSELSPGAVLQFAAMRMLMDEGRFARLDFTEGDGQHKRLFATGGVECVDLLLLRRTAGNRLATAALGGFDGAVASAKRLADRPALRSLAQAIRR